jgi:hypothetical protein
MPAENDIDDLDEFADLWDDGGEQVRPINWDTLDADELHDAWMQLDRWVNWLRSTYGLPATVVPPLWHRHPELQWELSALHTHWQSAYDSAGHGSAPHGWHRDLADAIARLRDWTAASGSRLDRDRPTRQTPWPGEPQPPVQPDLPIHDRAADFADHLVAQVNARRALSNTAFATDTQELP